MGIYLNKGNAGFAKYLNSEYVDKTGMTYPHPSLEGIREPRNSITDLQFTNLQFTI